MEVDDGELVRLLHRAGHGDQRAFGDLYAHTAGYLFGVCLQMLGRRDAAEEALQEAYVRIWHAADTYSAARGSVLTWMASICRYRAIDRLRWEGRRPESDPGALPMDALADPEAGPQEFSAQTSEAMALAACLEALSDVQRRAIRLAFLEGLTHQEVGEQLASPLGSVKSWIRRGLQSLKRCLQP